MATAALPLPILDVAPLGAARRRDLCSDCGLSRTSAPDRCGKACQFIHPRYDELEQAAHGRARSAAAPDEALFGVHRRMVRGRLRHPPAGAQWSGITTTIAERLLTSGRVEAVLATASDPEDRWRPRPVLVRHASELAGCRGMKMGFSPVLGLLDEVARLGLKRIALIGIPCQVHALRALEHQLGLERMYLIGTPCSDNTTTENFHAFLARLTDEPERVTYCEFQPDYNVELRFDDGTRRRIPFIQLPIADLPSDFFPLTCRACFDYTNALSDLTVGYMGGSGEQWLLVRNDRGEELLQLLGEDLVASPLTSAGSRTAPVRGFLANLRRSVNGLPVRRAPQWLRPLIGWAMPRIGPRGLEFARARVEMKQLEGILQLRAHRPHRLRRMVPDFAWRTAQRYGLTMEER